MKDYWLLIRPPIVGLVLFGMAAAAWTAGAESPSWSQVGHALLGTAMVIAGAIAMNQRYEHAGDAKMARTAARPLPAGKLSRRGVVLFSCVITAAGLGHLLFWSNLWVAGLAAVSWGIYVLAYTPLKSVTVWQTPIGAVAGAMPMLLGAAVCGGPLGPMAWSLFGIVFFWQFPHSMAIAWLYRQEFATAEVKLPTVLDPSGRTAGVLSLLGAIALVPVSLVPAWIGAAGLLYGVSAAVLDTVYLAFSAAFMRNRNDKTARRLLRASLVYLTVLFVVLLAS